MAVTSQKRACVVQRVINGPPLSLVQQSHENHCQRSVLVRFVLRCDCMQSQLMTFRAVVCGMRSARRSQRYVVWGDIIDEKYNQYKAILYRHTPFGVVRLYE